MLLGPVQNRCYALAVENQAVRWGHGADRFLVNLGRTEGSGFSGSFLGDSAILTVISTSRLTLSLLLVVASSVILIVWCTLGSCRYGQTRVVT
jgi:hypothetical protein